MNPVTFSGFESRDNVLPKKNRDALESHGHEQENQNPEKEFTAVRELCPLCLEMCGII